MFVRIWAGESPPLCCLPAERWGWVPLGGRPPEAPHGSSPRRGNLDRPGPVPIHQSHVHQDPKPQNLPAHLWGRWLINAQRLIGGPTFYFTLTGQKELPNVCFKMDYIVYENWKNKIKKVFFFNTIRFIWKVEEVRVRLESCQDTNHETATLSRTPKAPSSILASSLWSMLIYYTKHQMHAV